MKKLFGYLLFSAALAANAQETYIYDQESATENQAYVYGYTITTNNATTLEQSFTPTLSSIGFVRLALSASHDDPGGWVHVTLWSTTTGTAGGLPDKLLASTESIYLPQYDYGFFYFDFSSPVAVTPGAGYYFQLALQSGDPVSYVEVGSGYYNYPGFLIWNGEFQGRSEDLWFQEGTYIVREPPSLWLMLLGGGVWFYARRTYRKHRFA